MTHKIRGVDVEKCAYYVNKRRQNVGLETCKWRQIVTSQTAHTKYKWPPYDPEPNPPPWKFSAYATVAKYTTNVPSFTFILHVHRQANCCFETLFLEFSERTIFKTIANICGCFQWASSEYWEDKTINCWDCIVSHHWEGNNSRERIRRTY